MLVNCIVNYTVKVTGCMKLSFLMLKFENYVEEHPGMTLLTQVS